MKIIDQRYLEGGNRYSTQPCLLSILEIEAPTPAATTELRRRLHALLPGLRRLRGMVGRRAGAVPAAVELVQQTAIELRRLVLNEVTLGFVGVVPCTPGRYRLALPYGVKAAAAPSLALATQLVDAMLAGRPFNLKAGLAHLRALADRRRQPRGSRARAALRAVLAWRAPSAELHFHALVGQEYLQVA